MPYQLRRTVESIRNTITPLQGELLYVTDTNSIYVGDGVTSGGIDIANASISSGVTNLNDLTDVTAQYPFNKDMLLFNGATWDNTPFAIINDGSPTLGGDLDLNGYNIINNSDFRIALNKRLIVSKIQPVDDYALIINNTGTVNSPTTLVIDTTNQPSHINLLRSQPEGSISSDYYVYGSIGFERNDANGRGTASRIVGSSLSFRISTEHPNGTYPENGVLTIVNGQCIGLGTYTPSTSSAVTIGGVGILKLPVSSVSPIISEEGMFAVADGLTTGWDPKETNSGISYPVYYNGVSWVPLV